MHIHIDLHVLRVRRRVDSAARQRGSANLRMDMYVCIDPYSSAHMYIWYVHVWQHTYLHLYLYLYIDMCTYLCTYRY